MRYPSLRRTSPKAILVPSLSGGLNLADALNMVNDNQLTDVKNMWFQNATLKTRPAIVEKSNLGTAIANSGTFHKNYIVDLEQSVDGEKSVLCVHKTANEDTPSTTYLIKKIVKGEIDFTLNFTMGDYIVDECFFTSKPTVKYNHIIDFPNYLPEGTILSGTGIFMHISENKKFPHKIENDIVTEYVTKKIIRLCEIVFNETTQEYIIYQYGYEDYYKPTVYINGKGDSYSSLPITDDTSYAPATFFEGYSEYTQTMHKFCYTTDGTSASFTMPINLSGMVVRITLYKPFENKYYQSVRHFVVEGVEIPLWLSEYGITGENGYGVTLNNNTFTFTDVPPNALNGFENNLVIEVGRWYDVFKEDEYVTEFGKEAGEKIIDSKLHGATITKWFGGTGKGTRLFFGGCSGKHQNILMWSKVNDPSYISENNYNYVGTAAQKITALHRQNESLVIFKENELFYTQYTGQLSTDANEVISGAVIDVETNSTIFPFFQINSEVGCNIPKSIQLCGNRLVWATKNKKIYTLKSANQYSNANIFELSETIERGLKTLTEEELNHCKSCVYEGYYILTFDNKTYLLNIDNYYYKNTNAYADSRNQKRRLEWFYWETPKSNGLDETAYLVDEAGCHIISFYVGDSSDLKTYCHAYSYLLDENGTEDITHSIAGGSLSYSYNPINSIIQTKIFDFNAPDRYKKIEQLYIGFGETGGTTTIKYITENGTKETGQLELYGNADEYSPEYIKIKRLLPGVKRALRFGVRLDCIGKIAVNNIILKYNYIGVVR